MSLLTIVAILAVSAALVPIVRRNVIRYRTPKEVVVDYKFEQFPPVANVWNEAVINTTVDGSEYLTEYSQWATIPIKNRIGEVVGEQHVFKTGTRTTCRQCGKRCDIIQIDGIVSCNKCSCPI